MSEMLKVRSLFFFGCCVLVSGCYSLGELRYALFSKQAEARVTESYITQIRSRRSEHPVRIVKYSFQDAMGQQTQGSDRVDPESVIEPNEAIAIDFIPGGGEFDSRIRGHRNLGALLIFGLCVLVVAGLFAWLAREANQPVRKRSTPAGRR